MGLSYIYYSTEWLLVQNQIYSLEELFKLGTFRIPNYQRAYAWEIFPQLEEYLSDLRQQVIAQSVSSSKSYFLGTVLLHEHDSYADVVDGQQRLTTSVIFIASMLAADEQLHFLDEKRRKLLKRYFVYDDDEETQKFCTIVADDNYFRSQILGIGECIETILTASSRNLLEAKNYFINNIADDEWVRLAAVLTAAQVMAYTVNDYADATQIFELQNDRGKSLSTLESLKSFLMHQVYLHAQNPNDRLKGIQERFAQIFRDYESFKNLVRAPDEDAVLSYHCAAYLKWSGDDWRYPKSLVKEIVQGIENKRIPPWVELFVGKLANTFETIKKLYCSMENSQLIEVAELIVLGRTAPFWPLLIRCYNADKSEPKSNFCQSVRLMEIYSFRGFGMSNLRADAGQSSMYTYARDFSDLGDINTKLYDMCYWYDIESRFLTGLESPKAYQNNRRDLTYLLWKYENFLRSQPGSQQPNLSWKDFIKPENGSKKFSLEHISPQSSEQADIQVCWEDGDEEQEFKHIALHRLGNLVLDSVSTNSSKGKKAFIEKLPHLEERSTYLSQGELRDISRADSSGSYEWGIKQIKIRQSRLVDFACMMWNPERYI